jgi:hypothetical protein
MPEIQRLLVNSAEFFVPDPDTPSEAIIEALHKLMAEIKSSNSSRNATRRAAGEVIGRIRAETDLNTEGGGHRFGVDLDEYLIKSKQKLKVEESEEAKRRDLEERVRKIKQELEEHTRKLRGWFLKKRICFLFLVRFFPLKFIHSILTTFDVWGESVFGEWA